MPDQKEAGWIGHGSGVCMLGRSSPRLRSGDGAVSWVRGGSAEAFWYPDKDLRKAEVQPYVFFGGVGGGGGG